MPKAMMPKSFHASSEGVSAIESADHNPSSAPGLSAWRPPHPRKKGGTARPEHLAGQGFGASSEDPGDRDSGDSMSGGSY